MACTIGSLRPPVKRRAEEPAAGLRGVAAIAVPATATATVPAAAAAAVQHVTLDHGHSLQGWSGRDSPVWSFLLTDGREKYYTHLQNRLTFL